MSNSNNSKFDGSKGPPEINGMVSLKVDNLTYRTNIEDLERYFKKFGDVGDIYIPRDRNTHESRGFAFVRFFEERDAEDAMDSMDGKIIDGREIRVAMARYGRPANQFDPRRQGRTGGRGGGGYRDNRDGGHRDRDRRDRRSSPRRKRSYSRSRSRSPRHSRRSRTRSRSPKYHKRSPSRSRSPAPVPKSRSRSRTRSRSRGE